MAEFVMRDIARKRGFSDKIEISSLATSDEELGNPVHWGTVRKLSEHGISCAGKYAVQMCPSDLEYNDMIVIMDRSNRYAVERMASRCCGRNADAVIAKIHALKEFTASGGGDVADPWYTGNFDETWDDVYEGCNGLADYLIKEGIC